MLLFIFLYLLNLVNAINIGFITMAIGQKYIEDSKCGMITKENYCNKYDYKFINLNISLDLSRPIPWSKILIIEQNIDVYDWIFYSDADSLIMNPSIKLESLIDDNYDLIITRDQNNLNSGNFLLKNSEWSKNFLKDIYEQKQYINHPWWENMAIIDLYDNNQNIRDKTKILDVRSMNSYVNNYQKGDFIIHFAGSQGNIKSLMELYYSKVN